MNDEARKMVLKMLPYTAHVVGVTNGEEISAYTGSWLTQCSFHPPMIVIGVKKDSLGHKMIDQGRAFTINFLPKDRASTAEYFFDPAEPSKDSLGTVRFRKGTNGAPILDVACCYIECEVSQVIDTHGDHVLAVGRIIDAGVKSKESPLLASDGNWTYAG